jgi:hypothetical protein
MIVFLRDKGVLFGILLQRMGKYLESTCHRGRNGYGGAGGNQRGGGYFTSWL